MFKDAHDTVNVETVDSISTTPANFLKGHRLMRQVKLTFLCSEQEALFFQSLPKRLGVTMSAVVRDALYFYYKNYIEKKVDSKEINRLDSQEAKE